MARLLRAHERLDAGLPRRIDCREPRVAINGRFWPFGLPSSILSTIALLVPQFAVALRG